MADSLLLVRPHFFPGRRVTAEDLTQEQNYYREKLKRHNRCLHGLGVVTGLRVTAQAGTIVVDAGMALDCEGNEIVVGTTQKLPSPLPAEVGGAAYISVRYVEKFCDTTATPAGPQASTIQESFEIVLGYENHNSGHRHLRARWLACGMPHPLVMAKLRRGPQGWRVDRRYRVPVIK